MPTPDAQFQVPAVDQKPIGPQIISPSNGRVVLYVPKAGDDIRQIHNGQPLTAHVVHVWHDRMVNLAVYDSDGNLCPRTSVVLMQPGDDEPIGQSYCHWMPYQLGQAAKTEAVAKQLTEACAAENARKAAAAGGDAPVKPAAGINTHT